MNNKKIGTDFEREVVEWLSEMGYWVHFMSPAPDGSQPCDLIYCKDGKCWIADCKTSSRKKFSINRLEYNQVFAFEKWLGCGNFEPGLFVKYEGHIYGIPYLELQKKKEVELNEIYRVK